MKIFDLHIHTSFESSWLKRIAHYAGVDFTPAGLQKEMKDCQVTHCASMGIRTRDFNVNPLDPTPYDTSKEFKLKNICYAGGINPYMCDGKYFENTRKALEKKELCALKVYLGYFMLPPDDPAYLKYYDLAEAFNVPLIFHTGAAASSEAGLCYSHPLRLDELAVRYRNVTFIMAHMGNPFLMEAAELIRKNENVYADLSGFIEGPESVYSPGLSAEVQRISEAVARLESPNKILYGSDWPLTLMKPYIEFIKRVFPNAKDQRKVFFENASKIFKRSMTK